MTSTATKFFNDRVTAMHILTLRTEAAMAGDEDQVSLCRQALVALDCRARGVRCPRGTVAALRKCEVALADAAAQN